MDCRLIIEKLRKEQDAQMEELRFLLEHLDEESSAYLRAAAAEEAGRHLGSKIYVRGLIEFTNYCKNELITGELAPTGGAIERADFTYVYLDQEYSLIQNGYTVSEQAETFNLRHLPEHEIKIILNRYLFPASEWDKSCRKLSGGEKMRLAFRFTLRNGAQHPVVFAGVLPLFAGYSRTGVEPRFRIDFPADDARRLLHALRVRHDGAVPHGRAARAVCGRLRGGCGRIRADGRDRHKRPRVDGNLLSGRGLGDVRRNAVDIHAERLVRAQPAG